MPGTCRLLQLLQDSLAGQAKSFTLSGAGGGFGRQSRPSLRSLLHCFGLLRFDGFAFPPSRHLTPL